MTPSQKVNHEMEGTKMNIGTLTNLQRAFAPREDVDSTVLCTFKALFVTLPRLFEPKQQFRHPVEILLDDKSGEDMLDWAERHLCGMVDADPQKYFMGRRYKS